MLSASSHLRQHYSHPAFVPAASLSRRNNCSAFVPIAPLPSRRASHEHTPIARSRRARVNMLVETFLLRTSPRWLTLEPANAAIPHENVLFIDRNTLAASVRTRTDCAALAEPDSERLVYGLVGLVDTLHDAHLLVVSQREAAGEIMERPVWRVSRMDAIPVRGAKMLKKKAASFGLDKAQLAEEALVTSMLAAAVSLPGFYFSHALDLTRSAQKQTDVTATAGVPPASPDFLRADMRFTWNRFAAQRLVDLGAIAWIVPVILGYVDVRHGLVNGKAVHFGLVSRRCADRPGLRFTARGADVYGNCSNFVETEQIVSHGDAYSSYVQVRGSIPLLWKQEACLVYKPKATLKEVDTGGKNGLCQTAFEKHFDSLFEQYGPVTAISLIDQRGSEKMLCDAFKNAVELMGHSKLHFVAWDFHQRTKGMKYENVDQDLLPSIDTDLEAYGYFYTKDGTVSGITRRQRGIIRTNCIDSLDRTNVVQSVIAHRIMDASLKVMGVLDSNPDSSSTGKFEPFERDFKHTWADHANALSNFYAGSNALKTDYTRTGKRSKVGMAQDGVNAMKRYVYQNFLDGRRQDGIDLLLGVVQMPASAGSRSADMSGDAGMVVAEHRRLSNIGSKAEPLMVREKFLPHLVVLSVSIAIVGYMVPLGKMSRLIISLLGMLAFFMFSKLTVKAGHKLAARPKLDGTH